MSAVERRSCINGAQHSCRPAERGRCSAATCNAMSMQTVVMACSLCAGLQGAAGPALLRSYDAERRPVALANTALSVANWHAAMRIPQVRVLRRTFSIDVVTGKQ